MKGSMRIGKLKKSSNLENWQLILGPLPIGTFVRFRDKRYKKGYVDGKIAGYSRYYRYVDDEKKMKPRTFSYRIKTNQWSKYSSSFYATHWKRPDTVMKVLNRRRKKER